MDIVASSGVMFNMVYIWYIHCITHTHTNIYIYIYIYIYMRCHCCSEIVILRILTMLVKIKTNN